MAIPDFQTIMLPLLRLAADGTDHTLGESVQAVADEFHLSPAERVQRQPSGSQTTIYNRVAWASSYLRYAGLLIATGRGHFRITEQGGGVLASPPGRVDVKYLMKFPEFKAYRARSGKGGSTTTSVDDAQIVAITETPDEAIASSYAAYRASVEQELLDRVKDADPSFFEQLVVQLLVAMGYGGSQEDAGMAVGKSGDGGIDGVIKEDRLGLDTIYLQAKKWDGTVGRPVVHAFAGALAGKHARRGVLITTSTFSTDARAYVSSIEQRIVLIDGRELAKLMFEFGVGVAPSGPPYVMKRVDPDFFPEV